MNLMKKYLIVVGLACGLLTSVAASANDKQELQSRLEKISGFSAQFKQDVKTADHVQVQQGSGDLWVNRPYFFNWTMNEPDETSIISDGKTLWVYTPALEQVTIMNFKNAVDNRLLQLITDNNSGIWDVYKVTRKQDSFNLTATDGSKQNFVISVKPNGTITNFTIIEADGQRSFYALSNQKQGKVDPRKFRFSSPKGITIDDQR